MLDEYEHAIARENIIEMMGICEAKFDKKHRDQMLQCGAIFKVKKGRPPRVHIMGFPSRIMRYISIKASQGGVL